MSGGGILGYLAIVSALFILYAGHVARTAGEGDAATDFRRKAFTYIAFSLFFLSLFPFVPIAAGAVVPWSVASALGFLLTAIGLILTLARSRGRLFRKGARGTAALSLVLVILALIIFTLNAAGIGFGPDFLGHYVGMLLLFTVLAVLFGKVG